MTKSIQQLERFIRRIAADSQQIAFTLHALSRMRQRQITRLMVLEVLRHGKIQRAPEPNLIKASLECRVEYFVAGRQIGVVAAVSEENPTVIVVTAMEIS